MAGVGVVLLGIAALYLVVRLSILEERTDRLQRDLNAVKWQTTELLARERTAQHMRRRVAA